MDNFEKIIRDKVEQFEVPYNDAHWAEMEGKLNSIRTAKIRKNIITAVSVIAVLSISTYLFLTNNNKIDDNITTVITDNSAIANKQTTNNNSKPENNVAINTNRKNNTTEVLIINNEETSNIITSDNINETESPLKEILTDNNETNKNDNSEIAITADFIVYNNSICLGEPVSFESLEKNSSVSYTWDFGDGATSNKPNPKHTYEKDGVYSIALTLKNKQTGKEIKSYQDKVVNILPIPNVDFSYNELSLKNDNNKLKYPYTTFDVKKDHEDYSYNWELGNGKNAKTKNAKTIYEKAGNYKVSLIAKTENGCSTITTKNVVIKNGIDLYAPTGFKPNTAISTESETFIPMALLGWEVQFTMTILNNSGKTVYKTSDRNAPWNGKINNNGQLLNEGVYFWQVNVYDAEGIQHVHSGNVTLLK